jgi:hypothetical protein
VDTDDRQGSNAGAGRSDDLNLHVAWRMTAARRIAEGYEYNQRLAALTVAGSVGAGLADRWSDLELDAYWWQPPTDADRRTPIDRAGAVLEDFWDYDAPEQEWSENYRLGQLAVTVSNFTVGTIEQFLDLVVDTEHTDPVKHMRLAAIQRGHVMHGAELIDEWRARASRYPDQLITAMVEQSLTPTVLTGWSARDALVSRGDHIAIHGLLCRIEQAVLGTLLALNRTYQPHLLTKWQHHLIAGLDHAPDALPQRLEDLWHEPYPQALMSAETLLAETLQLAAQYSSADLGAFREALAERRRPTEALRPNPPQQ